MTHRVVVDRIEGRFAVLDTGFGTVDWPLEALPFEVREGQVLSVAFQVEPDDGIQEEQERLERLRRTGPKGNDIDL